jgi:glucose/arabinose dehydrogenase
VRRFWRHGRPFGIGVLAVVLAAVWSQSGSGQQSVPFNNNIPVAPLGLSGKGLPSLPRVYDTAEGERIRVVAVTTELEYPWSLTFVPDGTLLVTERLARLRVIRNGVLDPEPVPGGPDGYFAGESGLPGAVHGYMDVALHPQFARNRQLYLSYVKPLGGDRRTTAVARAQFDGRRLSDVRDIWVQNPSGTTPPGTTRLAFDRDGMLYVSTTGDDPQDPNTIGGKVLRLRDDGSVPPDNPFVGQAGHRPEVYTLGHRNALGLRMHPGTGQMWQNENGPNGGDEINILRPGANYGWPVVSYGRTYQGPWQNEPPGHAGFEPPLVYWTPSIAVSGMAFYTGDRFP